MEYNKKTALIITLFLSLVLISTLVTAAIPDQISFEGRLKNSTGAPIDGQVNVSFELFETKTGGTPIYTEDQTVNTTHGFFSTIIGQNNPIKQPLDKQVFLQIKVRNDTLSPRQPLTSAPYALNAKQASNNFNVSQDLFVNKTVSIGTTNKTNTLNVDGTGVFTENIKIGDESVITNIREGKGITITGENNTRNITSVLGNKVEDSEAVDNLTINNNGSVAIKSLERGNAVSNQILKWNSTSSEWQPTNSGDSSDTNELQDLFSKVIADGSKITADNLTSTLNLTSGNAVVLSSNTAENKITVGVDSNSIGNSEIANSESYTLSGLTVSGDAEITGDLTVIGQIKNTNVTNINVNGSILPPENFSNTFDVGSNNRLWNTGYFGSDVKVKGNSVLTNITEGNGITITGSGNSREVTSVLGGNIEDSEVDNDITIGDSGSVSTQSIGSGGAVSGQVLKWNGNNWIPATDQYEADTTVEGCAGCLDIGTEVNDPGGEDPGGLSDGDDIHDDVSEEELDAIPFTSTGILTRTGPNDFQIVKANTLDVDKVDGYDANAFVTSVDDVWVNESGDTMTGALNMNNNAITGVPKPTNPSDAVPKEYVDNTTGNGTPSGINGAIQYNNNGLFDASNLYFEDSNNRIGLATTSPQNLFHIAGNTRFGGPIIASPNNLEKGLRFYADINDEPNNENDSAYRFYSEVSPGTTNNPLVKISHGGNVGIGTTNPDKQLHVKKSAQIEGNLTIGTSSTFITGSGVTIKGEESATKPYVDQAVASGAQGNNGMIQYNQDGNFSGASQFYYDNTTGNVGIGTTTPSHKLEVIGNTSLGSNNNKASGENSVALGNEAIASGRSSIAAGNIVEATGDAGSVALGFETTASGVEGAIAMGSNTDATGTISTAMGADTTASGRYSTAIGRNVEAAGEDSIAIGLDGTSYTVSNDNVMSITGGNVGIGTINPNATLDVEANSGDLYIGNNGSENVFKVNNNGSVFSDEGYSTPAADLAEKYQTSEPVESGDVLVINTNKDETLKKSENKRSTLVAGVVSTKPGITLGEETEGAPVALTGRVPVKVTGSVERGDLLTTSSKEGVAKACEERSECVGAILGKALENTESAGKIKALITLE